jgi:hypothetical protein
MIIIDTYLSKYKNYVSVLDNEHGYFDGYGYGFINIQHKAITILGKENFNAEFDLMNCWYSILTLIEYYLRGEMEEFDIGSTCRISIQNISNKTIFSVSNKGIISSYEFKLHDFFLPTLLTGAEYFFSFLKNHSRLGYDYASVFNRIEEIRKNINLCYKTHYDFF